MLQNYKKICIYARKIVSLHQIWILNRVYHEQF